MDETDAITQFEIQEGWDVLADGERIGRVAEVHSQSFTVETGGGTQREVAFGDIESADDGQVVLSFSGDELTSELEA